MTRWMIATLAACAGLSLPPNAAAQTSAADQLYAEIARLPAAERQKRLEDGARREGKLVLIHTMRGNLSVDHVALSGSASRSSPWNSKATSARRTPPSA